VDNLGGIPLPNAVAKVELNVNNYIGVNRAEDVKDDKGNVTGYQQNEKRVSLQSQEGTLQLKAGNYDTVQTYALARGKGVGGISNATSWILGNVTTAVWIDNADMNAPKVRVYASTGGSRDRTHFIADSYTELKALAGKVAPTTRISGLVLRQTRSNDTEKVTWGVPKYKNVTEPIRVLTPNGEWVEFYTTVTKTTYEGDILHVYDNTPIWTQTSANYKRWQKKIMGVTITLTKASVTNKIETGLFSRCDFCNEGVPVDVNPTDPGDMNQRYQDAYERAIANINVIEAMARALSIDQTALMASRLAKGLLPLTYMNTLANRSVTVTRARYGDEENEAAAAIFVTDVKNLLEKDVRLEQTEIARYRMWENNATFHSVYLLPNAARLYVDAGNELDYVTDILQGEVLNDGYTYEIEVITALNKNAFANPEIPIGRTGRLNFATGVLTIPSYTDFELYLHEVSAAWLIEQIESGYIRTLTGDQEAFNASAVQGSENLPGGNIVEGLTDGGTVEGIRLYWIGDTPETAADPDQTLLLLMVNEETDEVDAFRTSVNMLRENAPLLDVSMYLFRDSESDRREEEKYNAFWFDSLNKELSLVKVLTNVVGSDSLEVPRPIRIKLRAYKMAGIDLPVYSLTDHLFLMCDGTTGDYSLFDGTYSVTFDGDTFDSDYTRVEGINGGDPAVTIKKNQPVWPEWIDGDEAEDIGGKQYRLIDDEWVEQPGGPIMQADQAADDAA